MRGLAGAPNPDAKNCLKGTWGAEFTGIGPRNESEPVVIKHRYSAFVNTRLDSILRTLKAENIIVLGVARPTCASNPPRATGSCSTITRRSCRTARRRTIKAAHDMTLKTHAKHFGKVATSKEIIDAWTATHSVASDRLGASACAHFPNWSQPVENRRHRGRRAERFLPCADGALAKTGAPTAAAMEMIPNLQRLLAGARAAGAPVIFIQTIHEDATDSEAWTWRLATAAVEHVLPQEHLGSGVHGRGDPWAMSPS